MARNEDRIFDVHRLRARAPQTGDVPTVVIDDDVADRNRDTRRPSATIGARDHSGENEPGRTIDAARPWPTARDLDAPAYDFHFRRRRVGNGEEIVGIVPDLLLRLERVERNHPAEAHRQCAAPASAAARATELEADLCKLGRAVLVSSEARRLHHAEHICVAQGCHRLGRNTLCLLCRKRPRGDVRPQFADAIEDVGELGPWAGRQRVDGMRGLSLACRFLQYVTTGTVQNVHHREAFGNQRN